MLFVGCLIAYLLVGMFIVTISYLAGDETLHPDDDMSPIIVIGWPVFILMLFLMGVTFGLAYVAKSLARFIKSKFKGNK